MKVVVTGPTGTIGHAFVKLCVQNGDDVLAICRKGSRRITAIPSDSHVSVLELDLNEYENYISTHELSDTKYDIFFNLAWYGTNSEARNDPELQSLNIKYSLDAVRLAAFFGCKTFIGAGSQAEYGRVEGYISPDTPVNPASCYGITKLCAGQLTRALCKQNSIKHIWTRILSVYGPFTGDDSMVIATLKKMIKGEKVLLTKGEQHWDFLYSDDAAKALYLLAKNGVDGKTYVIGSGKTKSIRDFVEIMEEETSTTSEILLGAVPYAQNQVMRLCADISELEKDTGFKPEITFEEGIRSTIDYLKE